MMFEGVPTWPKPDRYWRIVENFRVNILYTAPTVIRSLMRLGEAWAERYDLRSLRILGSVGEPINPEAWQWYHKHIGAGELPIVDTWWQTETGGAMISPMPYATKLKPGSASKPLPGIDAAVMGSAGRDGEETTGAGHLVIRKPWPGMMLGVFNDEEKYQSYFSRFGCYESGDGAQVDADGYFWILGRIDDSINVSGHRLSTAEIEAVLAACPEVGEAAVVPMPHRLKGEAIYAYVLTRDEVPWSEELRKKLRDTVRRDIGALASPEYIQFVEAMPKTTSGKIIRRMLRKIAGDTYEDMGDTTALADPHVLAGKTTLTLHIIAECQKLGGTCAFVDAEHALDVAYARRLGVNTDELLISQPDYGEQALDIADMLVRSGAVDMVVIDSVAALIPQAELEGDMGETQVGGHARLMSHAMRRLTGTIHKSRTSVIFINQIRMKIGVQGYGSPETTTGGNALKFYSSVRLDIRKIQTLKDKEEAYGSLTRVKVVKNKMAPPFREAKFDIIWGTGISRSGELIDLGVDAGIVDKSGAWFAFGSEKLGQGKEKVRALLDETPELRNAIESQLIEHLGMNPRPVVHAPEETLPDPENAPVDDMDDEI